MYTGRSIGLGISVLIGVRVIGEPIYYPAYNKNGNGVNQQCKFGVLLNTNKGTDQRTGDKGKRYKFNIVAWGKLADTCARSLSKGRALDLICRPEPYEGTLFDENRQPRLDNAGLPIKIQKEAHTILFIIFGEESEKHIINQIMVGERPQGWSVPNSQDNVIYKQMLDRRNSEIWNGGDKFGFAKVSIPQGPGIVVAGVNMANNQPMNYYASSQPSPGMAPAGYPQNPPVGGPGVRPQEIANAFSGQANGQVYYQNVNGVMVPVNPPAGPQQGAPAGYPQSPVNFQPAPVNHQPVQNTVYTPPAQTAGGGHVPVY